MKKVEMIKMMIDLNEVGASVSETCANGDIGPYYDGVYAQLKVEMAKPENRVDADLADLWDMTQRTMSVCGYPWTSESYGYLDGQLTRYRKMLAA